MTYQRSKWHKDAKINELENKKRVKAYLARNNAAVVTYRVYRLALACTIEYAKAATALAAPTKAQVLAKMVTSMNRVNGVYETDVAVHMNLVAKNDLWIISNDPKAANLAGNGEWAAPQNEDLNKALTSEAVGMYLSLDINEYGTAEDVQDLKNEANCFNNFFNT